MVLKNPVVPKAPHHLLADGAVSFRARHWPLAVGGYHTISCPWLSRPAYLPLELHKPRHRPIPSAMQAYGSGDGHDRQTQTHTSTHTDGRPLLSRALPRSSCEGVSQPLAQHPWVPLVKDRLLVTGYRLTNLMHMDTEMQEQRDTDMQWTE